MSTQLCKECFDDYTKQAELLTRIVNSNVTDDLRTLASDILYGLLLTMYEVDDEEEDEYDNEVHTNSGDNGSFTITVPDLAEMLRSYTTQG